MTYTPRLNDYVKWQNSHTNVEGWVYFVDAKYCTIEISVKDKPDDLFPQHKKTHCCVLCYPENWHELTYIKSRNSEDNYKAQQYRYSDP